MDRSTKSRLARLNLEGLEDRLALSHAALFPILDPGLVAASGKPILPTVPTVTSPLSATASLIVPRIFEAGAVLIATPDHTHAAASGLRNQPSAGAPDPCASVRPVPVALDAVFASHGVTANAVTLPPPRPGLLLPH